MRYELRVQDILKETRLVAIPGEYDGYPPLAGLILNWIAYSKIPPERLAAAFVLAFHRWSSGELVFPEPILPVEAEAVRRIHLPTEVSVTPVKYAERKIEGGSTTLAINRDGEDHVDAEFKGFDISRVFDLRILRTSETAGASITPLTNTVAIPSNAWLFAGEVSDSLEELLPFIAVAVLVSTDLNAGIIRLPVHVERTSLFREVSALLLAAGLLLEVPEPATFATNVGCDEIRD